MKKIAIVLTLSITLFFIGFKPYGGVVGKIFPYLQGEDYNGKKVNLPVDTKGKYTLIGMAFSNAAESDLKTWINPIYNKFIVKIDRSKADVFDAGNLVVLGGVGKIAGTVAGALGIGVVNKFLEPVSGAVLGKIIVLILIIALIQKRPQGLFALKGRTMDN